MQNDTITVEDILVVSYKTKHNLTIQSSYHTLWYQLKRAENLFVQKPAHGCL